MIDNSSLRYIDQVVLVLASNERYFIGLYCAIASSIHHLDKKYKAKIFILDGGIAEESKTKLVKLSKYYEGRASIHFVEIDETTFQNATVGPGSSYMAYCRLLIPSLIKEPKVLYIDADVLVFHDLAVLYETELNDGSVLAAVPDSQTIVISDDSKEIANKLEIDACTQYYNSGVLLMDLDTLRKINFLDRSIEFLAYYSGQYRFWDQSAINFIFYEKIQSLPDIWNFPSWKFDEQESNSFKQKVIHFTSSTPWIETEHTPSQALFEEYAKQLGISIEYSTETLQKASLKKIIRNILSPVRAILYPLFSLIFMALGNTDLSKNYACLSNYWYDYFRNIPYRRRLFKDRIREIRHIDFSFRSGSN